MEIQVLGAHLLETADTRLTSVLIDEILALDAGGLTSGLSLSAQHKLKAILLTHQHYDHVRDIPMVGMSFLSRGTINIYSISPVLEVLTTHLLDNKLYPNFLEFPPHQPAMKFHVIEPYKPEIIEGYEVLAIPVHHPVPTVGYQLTSPLGKKVFYTGDTGSGLSSCWEWVSPDLLIIEVSGPNHWEKIAREAGHLTPGLLRQELLEFRRLKGCLPSVLLIHLSPFFEEDIRREVNEMANELEINVTLGQRGMKVCL